jgi:glycerate 2-kinase
VPDFLREIAIDIWSAGVAAVGSERLIRQNVAIADGVLQVVDQSFDVGQLGRVVVVGAGKAGSGMASAVEAVFSEAGLAERLTGWVNVPADCVRSLSRITLHAARPPGLNEPTVEGVVGSQRILELVSGLRDNDLCLVLLSGGGSALLPAPVAGVSLADKQIVTRLLMHGGATIGELNCVRKQLSRIKGGGLAREATAGTMISLIISDVIGDKLDVIASGPTVEDGSTPQEALDVLRRIVPQAEQIPASVIAVLESAVDSAEPNSVGAADLDRHGPFQIAVTNRILGSNSVAVTAAAERANELGFRVESLGSDADGIASELGRKLAERALQLRSDSSQPTCLLSGGEPTVRLAQIAQPRKGGRNQEVALGACAALAELSAVDVENLVVLAGGTDGEDGPTDAAGAICDASTLAEMHRRGLEPGDFLAINNAYEFFDQTGGLLKTGPTHTNVMDLYVVLAASQPACLSASE